MLMISLKLNGRPAEVDVPPDTSLLTVLWSDLDAVGPKFGCGRSQCGSCTVLIDGEPVKSCQTKVSAAAGREVTTLEGLLEDGQPNALQRAFIAEQAAQCGFCSSGMIMAAQALLDRNPSSIQADVRSALNGNLCRCGAHNRIVRAVLRAAQEG